MIINKKPPYEGTGVDPDRTRMEIDKLLQGYGVSGIQWTTDYKANKVELAFTVEVEFEGVKKTVAFKVQPPTFAAKRRTWSTVEGRYVTVWAPNWAQSMRLLYYWMKAKLEAVAYGLTTVEKEFLSQVVVQLKNGQTTTVGQALSETIETGLLALEARESPPADATDVTAEVLG